MSEVWEKMIDERRIRIRFATKTLEDFEKIMYVDINARSGRVIPPLLSGELEGFLGGNHVLVAEIKSARKAVGFVIFEDIQYGCYIRRLMMFPAQKNESIGTALVLLSMKYSGKRHFETIPAPKSTDMERMFRGLARDLRFEFAPQTKTSARISMRAPVSMDEAIIKSKIEEVLEKKYGWGKVS